MDLLGEEAGNAGEGGFDALAVVALEKGHAGFILSLAVSLAAAAKLHLLAFSEQVLHLIAGVGGVGVKLAVLGQGYFHGLEGSDVDKRAGSGCRTAPALRPRW